MPCVGACQPALSFAQLEKAWTDAGGSTALAPLMASIALAESGGIPNNTNPTDNGGKQTSWGLWQVSNGTHAEYANWSDPVANARVAVGKLNSQGLTAWGTYTSGAAQTILRKQTGGVGVIPALSDLTGSGTAVPGPGGVSVQDNEGNLIDLTMPSAIPNITVSRAVVRKILGAGVLVAGALVGLAGLAVLVGAKVRVPGPVGAVQGVLSARKAGRLEETSVTMAAEGRRKTATDKSDADRSRANRREAEEAVSARKRANRKQVTQERDAQRQEDALQRIEARRLANASGRKSSTPGHANPRRQPKRELQGSGRGDF